MEKVNCGLATCIAATISLPTWASSSDQRQVLEPTRPSVYAESSSAPVSRGASLRLAAAAPAESAQGTTVEQRGVEEVIVTAQRREQRIMDVPISMSVLSGESIDKFTGGGVTEALSRVPGVATTLSYQGGSTQLTVRGVSAAGALFFGSNPIAYYLDSVPFALVKSAVAPDSNPYDLERVEVLRGPQGTLYGASALNGVVRVLTHDADLDKFEFKARTSASSTEGGGENYRGDAAINVPIIEGKLAARAVVGYQDLSGWIDKPNEKDANDSRIANVRVKVNAQPTDELSVGLSAWRSRSDYGAPPKSADGKRSASLIKEPMSTDYDAYGLKLGYDFGNKVSVASSTSYIDYENPGDLDYLGLRLFTGLDSKIFSQEVTLSSSPEGVWRWSLGGMYRKGEDRLLQSVTSGAAVLAPSYEWRDRSKSSAVFGEITRLLVDGRLELTAGLRYFEDTVSSTEGLESATPLLDTESDFDSTTSRAILSWHAADNLTIYGSYSEGFRSGFDQFLAAKTILNYPPVQPDTLRNYEIGTKGNLWGGRVTFDSAVFFIDWKKVQQSLTVVLDGLPRAANLNGSSASGIGFEGAISFEPLDNLQLGVNFSWNDLTFDDPVFSGGIVLYDKGDRLNNSPEYTVGASVDYTLALGGSGFEGSFSASGNYTSQQEFRTLLNGLYRTLGDSLLIARAAFAIHAPDRWTATIYVDNVADEHGTPIRAPYAIEDWSVRPIPRTYGVQLEYQF